MKSLYLAVVFLLSSQFVLCQTPTDLYEYNGSKERMASVVQVQKIDSVTTFEKIVLEGFDSKIPFYHYRNERKENAPNIFLLHGLGDSKDCWVHPSEPYLDWSKNTTAIKDSLISLGYNILIPDAKFHGERSYELDFRLPQTLPPPLSKKEEDTKLFETLMTSTVKDLRIILDYIENRNGTKNFGAVGYSMGGNLAILLSIFDTRISSVVACVPPLNLPARDLATLDSSEKILQGQRDITPMTFASQLHTPILLLMGSKDFYATKEEVTTFFERVASEDKAYKFFESGHILPNSYKNNVINWVTKYNRN